MAALKHADLIHAVSYDYYGRRLASCSSDQRVKIADLSSESGEWEETDSWKAHDGPILKVVWAHPETGSVLATCSMDRSVKIWEEQDHEVKGRGQEGSRWVERARLVDARAGVTDIVFAPIHLGLKIASIAGDATVRIYEALEPYNHSHWTLMDDFRTLQSAPPKELETAFCLTWATSRWSEPMLAVGSMDTCRLYRQVGDGQNTVWQAGETLAGHKSLVRDVAWAPTAGRSYQLIATASKDGHVRIFKLRQKKESAEFDIELAADLDDHGAEVWKVSWNVTGTILASSGDDGRVRLWKASIMNHWNCYAVVSAER